MLNMCDLFEDDKITQFSASSDLLYLYLTSNSSATTIQRYCRGLNAAIIHDSLHANLSINGSTIYMCFLIQYNATVL